MTKFVVLTATLAFSPLGCDVPAVVPPENPSAAAARNPLPGSSGSMRCEVSAVVDGDSLECDDARRVRLLLIDAPEIAQGRIGAAARSQLLSIVPIGTQVTLELDVEAQDQYGRTLAYVVLPDGQIANEELLRRGVAVVSIYPPNIRYRDRFRATSAEAEAVGRGLWALDAFRCLPRDFRSGRCADP